MIYTISEWNEYKMSLMIIYLPLTYMDTPGETLLRRTVIAGK